MLVANFLPVVFEAIPAPAVVPCTTETQNPFVVCFDDVVIYSASLS